MESLSQILGHSDTHITMHYYGKYCNDELQRRFDRYGPLSQKATNPFSLQEAGGWNSLAMPRRYVEAAKIANEGVKL